VEKGQGPDGQWEGVNREKRNPEKTKRGIFHRIRKVLEKILPENTVEVPAGASDGGPEGEPDGESE
jgi:hypothetical protein